MITTLEDVLAFLKENGIEAHLLSDRSGKYLEGGILAGEGRGVAVYHESFSLTPSRQGSQWVCVFAEDVSNIWHFRDAREAAIFIVDWIQAKVAKKVR
jgi:hypothetical protein